MDIKILQIMPAEKGLIAVIDTEEFEGIHMSKDYPVVCWALIETTMLPEETGQKKSIKFNEIVSCVLYQPKNGCPVQVELTSEMNGKVIGYKGL